MLSNLVYLVQTDTTVGFSSDNEKKLSLIKNRPTIQKTLQTVDSFKTLKTKTRIPNKFKNRVRRSKNSTFIYENKSSFRVIDKNDSFSSFISKFQTLYSTSANHTKKLFNEKFSLQASDIIVYTKNPFEEKNSSKIYEISRIKLNKIR